MNQQNYYTLFKNKVNNYINYLYTMNQQNCSYNYNYSQIKYMIEYEFA